MSQKLMVASLINNSYIATCLSAQLRNYLIPFNETTDSVDLRGFLVMEIWKSIKGYEGIYEVSSLGRVKSLKRKVKHSKGGERIVKEKVLKSSLDRYGYPIISLHKKGFKKTRTIHQLVTEGFLNHKPCGQAVVVNHIDFNRTNNNSNNLEIVTHRENSNKKHLKSSSNYVGVDWKKDANKWRSRITINGKLKHLGYFEEELEASKAYQKELLLCPSHS